MVLFVRCKSRNIHPFHIANGGKSQPSQRQAMHATLQYKKSYFALTDVCLWVNENMDEGGERNARIRYSTSRALCRPQWVCIEFACGEVSAQLKFWNIILRILYDFIMPYYTIDCPQAVSIEMPYYTNRYYSLYTSD